MTEAFGTNLMARFFEAISFLVVFALATVNISLLARKIRNGEEMFYPLPIIVMIVAGTTFVISTEMASRVSLHVVTISNLLLAAWLSMVFAYNIFVMTPAMYHRASKAGFALIRAIFGKKIAARTSLAARRAAGDGINSPSPGPALDDLIEGIVGEKYTAMRIARRERLAAIRLRLSETGKSGPDPNAKDIFTSDNQRD